MKRIVSFILVIALSALTLCSCSAVTDFIAGNEFLNGILGGLIGNSDDTCEKHVDDNDDGICDNCEEELEDDSDEPSGVIFDGSVSAMIIYPKDSTTNVANAVQATRDYAKSNISKNFITFQDNTVPVEHEIVIGDTRRDITDDAKAALAAALESKKVLFDAMGIEEEDIAGYMVYSNGSSVAIVWTHFQIAEIAMEYFCENYLNESSLTLKAGFTDSNFLSDYEYSLNKYLEAREEKIMAEKWAALEAAIPEEYREEIMEEMHRYYALFEDKDESLVDWLASLYDVETGAWYGTVSAKVTEGFLPDIEHTYQALMMFGQTGMAEMFDGDWTKAVPYDIFQKAVRWVYNLQDPDGYFYHPQWPKEYIEANDYQIRITRDKGSANTLLKAFGINPKYTGFVSSDDNLIGNLGDSTVAAVSKVVAASATLEEYTSVEKYAAYLADFENSLKPMTDYEYATAFYTLSGHMQTTVVLMNDEMKEMTIDFYNRHQNPSNGMWSVDLYYSSTNAMHKIVSIYNQIGAEVQYVEEIINSTLEILQWDVYTSPMSTAYDLYNVWTVFPYLYQNIRKCSPGTEAEREARCAAIKDLVFEGAANAMYITYEQTLDFSHPDGSGSIYRHYSLGSSSNLGATAVPYTVEGSIAGFLTVDYTMPYYMLDALELGDYLIPIFTEQDRVSYINKLYKAVPTVKGALTLTEAKLHNFETEQIGSVPADISISVGASNVPNLGSYIEVADDMGNNVLEFNAVARTEEKGRNYNARFKANHTEEKPDVMSLEFDFKLNSGSSTKNITELGFLAGNTGSQLFNLSIGVDGRGTVYVSDMAGSKIGDIGIMGEYISVTIAYEWNQGVYRIYANGMLIGSSSLIATSAKHEMAAGLNIGSVSSTTANYCFDNICFKTYKQ